jgi:hypothetical protein
MTSGVGVAQAVSITLAKTSTLTKDRIVLRIVSLLTVIKLKLMGPETTGDDFLNIIRLITSFKPWWNRTRSGSQVRWAG